MLPGCARASRCSSAAFGPEAPPNWRDEHEQPVVAESLQQKGRGLGVVVRLGVQQDQEIALGGSKTSRSMGSTETSAMIDLGTAQTALPPPSL